MLSYGNIDPPQCKMQKIMSKNRHNFFKNRIPRAYSVGMLRFVFLRSEYEDALILGRTVKRHMLDALGVSESDAVVVGQYEEVPEEDTAVLSLDIPLVTLADIEGIARRMRAKGIKSLRLGSEDSPSKIVLGRGESGYFANAEAFLKIGDTKSYSMVYNHLRRRIVDSLLARGVDIPFADSVVIDCTADIQAGAKILPFSRIEGDARVCAGATVSASRIVGGVISAGAEVYASHIEHSEVGAGAVINMSHVADSGIGEGATVGPFARLRGADIKEKCRIGDFVEVKASSLGEGAKAAHLAYIGDANVGARTNIGCGTVFCNYDGKQKHRTDVGEDCFIGANTNLVAPISVGDGAFIAAGTTLTDDVPPSSFTVGRARQITKIR